MDSVTPIVVDRRRRLARLKRMGPYQPETEFLQERIQASLLERLAEISRPFARVALVGARGGAMARALRRKPVAEVIEVDHVAKGRDQAGPCSGDDRGSVVLADEETWPFGEGVFDAVVMVNNLHMLNDLPGALLQAGRSLKPDGLLLAGFPGGRTLHELRYALTQAEIEARGGAEPRVMPAIDVKDAGALLQRAGFSLPMADLERLTVRYREPLRLLRDLQASGQTNALTGGGRTALRRDVLGRALQLYAERFGQPDGKVPATFELVFLTGWRPDPSQQKPLKPGSARFSLARAIGGDGTKG